MLCRTLKIAPKIDFKRWTVKLSTETLKTKIGAFCDATEAFWKKIRLLRARTGAHFGLRQRWIRLQRFQIWEIQTEKRPGKWGGLQKG